MAETKLAGNPVIAFGHTHAVVDGNVKRVLARLFRIDSLSINPNIILFSNKKPPD